MHSQHSCFNLSEVAIAINTERSALNISLILAPGNHTLTSNLTVNRSVHFLMKSEDSCDQPAVINCGESSRVQLYSTAYVQIQGIILNGCIENEVKAVQRLIIQDSILSAADILNFGRALIISNSTMIIVGSALNYFMTNHSRGGAILSLQSDILVLNSKFSMNQAGKGGVMYCLGGTVLIYNSTFTKNSAKQGGVLYLKQNSKAVITNNSVSLFQDYLVQWNYFNTTAFPFHRGSFFCIGSNFTANLASEKGGVIYCTTENKDYTSTLNLDRSYFAFNNASNGAVFEVRSSNVTIHDSNFQNNEANRIGGVGYCHQSILLIKQSIFCYNRAGTHAGVLYLDTFTGAVINLGKFYNNIAEKIGGCLHLYRKSSVILTGMITYVQNSARYVNAAIINVYESNITCNGFLINITNNSGSITLFHSTGHFAGHMLFKQNERSIHIYESKVVISGYLQSTKERSHINLEGGCITLFLSTVTISGNVTTNDSIATNGGGILSISSKIFIVSRGRLTVTNNVAKDTGGGIYLYHSELHVKGTTLIKGNRAKTFGGAIHCISSIIVLIYKEHDKLIEITKNEATYGGGVCLEASSKFYIKQLGSKILKQAVWFTENLAHYGGGIYVVDNTTIGTCASSKVQTMTTSLESECFIQILNSAIEKGYPPIENYLHFAQNHANISGSNLYGGLLDRCTVYNLGKNKQYSTIANSLPSDTTSDPVRVCLCVSEYNSTWPDCTHSPSTLHVIKGYHNNITVQLAAVDHVKHSVNAKIIGSLESRIGHLREGQRTKIIGTVCTNLNFSVISPIQDLDYLVLYADGPCKDLGISALKIPIKFDPCYCPTGFEPEPEIKDRCVCSCHHLLKRIFPNIECNSETLLIVRNHDYWLSTTKKGRLQQQYFLTYKQCPSDYCHPSTTIVQFNLNLSHGSDAQCTFNRTGLLCGCCHPNLTLSLGSSRCIECPQLWPTITIATLIGAFLAGLALVAIILVLNLTVASGTLNGVIFYANIITIDQQLFMPFERPNFHSVFIAWLNLDVGFDVCFFKGLNAYAKAWLQLIFPLYIILTVVAVIIASHYSTKFANLILRKNPVATLATLILLSYAKLLHNIIEIFSYAILLYTAEDESDSFTEVVWLRDGSIAYLKGTHIPLFMMAVLIVILGSIYTLLLLSWQWLVKFSNTTLFLG